MWNLKYSNSFCHNKERLWIHKEHLERLIQVREKIDNKHPIDLIFLKVKANKVQNERDSKHKLKYENTILYNRMYSISKRPSYYNSTIYKPFYCPGFDKSKLGWRKKQDKIALDKQNSKLYKRFNNIRSFYPTNLIEQQTDFYQYLERNMSQKEINPNMNYLPYPVFRKNLTKQISIARSQSALLRPASLTNQRRQAS